MPDQPDELRLPPLTPAEGNVDDLDAARHADLDPLEPERELEEWRRDWLVIEGPA